MIHIMASNKAKRGVPGVLEMGERVHLQREGKSVKMLLGPILEERVGVTMRRKP